MKDKPLISVIIPAYNVAPYIRKSVESVINQTYKNLEIILVEDGATDDTGKICDELALQDNRIQVIHQKNQGLAGARNTGLDIVKGEWVAFLDSDDWIEPEMYEVLLKLAIEYNADISSCKSRNVGPGANLLLYKEDAEEILLLDSNDIILDFLHQTHVRPEVWNKLFKRELIKDIRFVVGQIREDIHWDRIIFTQANRMVYTSRVLHNYFQARPGNINSSFKVAGLCIYDEFDAWMKELKESGRHKQAEIVGCIAVNNFVMTDYVSAVKSGQDKYVKKQLLDYFDYFYKQIQESPYRSKIATTLFRINPRIYQWVLGSEIFKLYLKVYHSGK